MSQAKLYIVGLGPGGPQGITTQAREALDQAQVVVGYKTYLEMAAELLEGKEIVSGAMTQEMKRAQTALDLARQGKVVALVSGGDPGIYAMAPVVFELVRQQEIPLGPGGVEVEVIPGVPAVAAAAALLGAPLSHDFACISLSDRLTPWELIERRLELAAQADFVIALYNPKSKGRPWQYSRALEILAEHRGPRTPVGVVSRAGRPGQTVRVVELAAAAQAPVDMQTVVIVGSSRSFTCQGRMVTPRGYLDKYGPAAGG